MVARKNIPSVHAVADYFLLKTIFSEESITNLKMQKLVYYAQAWSLALHGRPIFANRIEAWARGPVCPDLYYRFKKQKSPSLDPDLRKTNPIAELQDDEINLLNQVWKKFSAFSGSKLTKLTHKEDPWKKAYGDLPQGRKCNVEITHESMSNYYKRQLQVG